MILSFSFTCFSLVAFSFEYDKKLEISPNKKNNSFLNSVKKKKIIQIGFHGFFFLH